MERIEQIPAAPRKELMKLFDELSAKRLVYIHAPPGYGKSFSMRIWLERRSEVSAWIAVSEPTGREPADFCECFIEALSNLQPDNIALKKIALHKSFSSAPYKFVNRALKMSRLFRQERIDLNAEKYVLVIDDFHLITHSDTLKRLPEIISGLPGDTTLFILSRAEPPESFSEFVLKDAISIVGIEHFKFSNSEIAAFFSACKRPLDVKQTQEIKAATDGWAVGLNAVLLSGGQIPNKKPLIRYLETFIRENVWEKWNEPRREFMLRISVADEFTPGFCNAVTGGTDSEEILDALVRENAFISVGKESIYYFNRLFRDFLQRMLERENIRLKKELCRIAGDWFYSRSDYYKAIKYYVECGDNGGIAKSFKLMYNNRKSPCAATEDMLSVIRTSVGDSIVDEYPFLLEVRAWAAFMEGRGADMESCLDRYFKRLPEIILSNPDSERTSIMLYFMDYRNSIIEFTKNVKELPVDLSVQAGTPSLSQNMPLFHRSGRDFSEYVADTDNDLLLLKKTVGALIGDEFDVIENLIRAGIAYEQGNLNAAHELALSAVAKIKSNFAPEIKFCSFMILAAVLIAERQELDARKILDGASDMIKRDKSYYLNANFQAFMLRMKLAEGDTKTAQNWLNRHADSPYGDLSFYRLYQHFTTARAYIVTGDYTTAILFLKKLLDLCENYRRILDVIETNILLAIAYWKKGRGLQNEAFKSLEKAISTAGKYGFTQIFANDGAELVNMLYKLQKRIVQKGYDGKISAAQARILYVEALAQSKYSGGMTCGRVPGTPKFTERQKVVLRHLCEGLTQKEIGAKMGLKPSAVKSHMILIYKKLDVSNGVDAIIKIKELKALNE